MKTRVRSGYHRVFRSVVELRKGASIYDVRTRGGGEGPGKADKVRELIKMRTRGEGAGGQKV